MSRLCSIKDVRERSNNDRKEDTGLITDLIDKVTARIKDKYQREVVPFANAEARTFRVNPKERNIDLVPFDLRTASSVILHSQLSTDQETLTANEDYILMPIGGDRKTGTFTSLQLADTLTITGSELNSDFGFSQIEITGNWGIWNTDADVHEVVKDAAILTVISLMDWPMPTIPGYPVEDGTQVTPAFKSGFDIPFDAHLKLERFLRYSEVF